MYKRVTAKRTYKASLFEMIFSKRKELLALYNAINNSNYTDPDALIVKTLDNAIYLGIKNDVSFLIDNKLCLYEHQSTYNPNMPLRDLLYVADQLQELIKDTDMYKTTLVKIPTPDFVVFYNGLDEQPDKSFLKLSDSFEVKTKDIKLELVVTMLNINVRHNKTIMAQCKTLRDYSIYVDKVRTYAESMDLAEAVTKAVDECIKGNILKDFLRSQKAEAIKVTLYEYDQALHEKVMKEEAREIALKEGLKEGEFNKLKQLVSKKVAKGCSPEEIADILEENLDTITEIINNLSESPIIK